MTNESETDDQPEVPADSAVSDCYSAGERGWMEFGQRLRAVLLRPLLVLLTSCRVTPDHVTLLAAVVGLGFAPLVLQNLPGWAVGCLVIHVLLDGIDGPLARFQQRASARGSFTDTFADQLVVTVVTITWMLTVRSAVALVAGTWFVFVYALVVAMAMVRNALQVPYSWLVRPRFFVYAAIAVEVTSPLHLTLLVLAVCNLLLSWKAWTGFRALRRRIPGPRRNS